MSETGKNTNIGFLQNPDPFVCPICKGNGLVPTGFYNQTSGQWTIGSVTPFEKCRSCEGEGVIWK